MKRFDIGYETMEEFRENAGYQYISGGCHGAVYGIDDSKIVKIGIVEGDMNFFSLIDEKDYEHKDLVPAFYGAFSKSKLVKAPWGSNMIREDFAGVVCERINGVILAEYYDKCKENGTLKEFFENFEEFKDKYKKFSFETGVVVTDLHLGNIMYDEVGDRLVLVDCGFFSDRNNAKEHDRDKLITSEVGTQLMYLDQTMDRHIKYGYENNYYSDGYYY